MEYILHIVKVVSVRFNHRKKQVQETSHFQETGIGTVYVKH